MESPNWGRRYLQLAATVLGCIIFGVYLSGYAFLSADYLAWYFPFQNYPQFSERGYFVKNHGLQDAVLVYFTNFSFLHQQLQTGILPLWNPLEGLGLSTAALHGNGYLFPIHWLTYGLLSPLAAWHLELLLVALLNLTCTFLLFQRLSGSVKGAMLGSTAWTLGGWCAAYFILPTYAWCFALYPATLLAIERQREGKAWSALQLALSVCGLILASHLQATIPALLCVTAFILWRGGAVRLRMLFSLLSGCLMATPHLVPLWELLRLSEREPLSLDLALSALLIPREYLCMIFPTLLGKPTDNFYFGAYLASPIINGREHCVFVGAVTLFLALLALVRTEKRAYRVIGGLTLLGLVTAGAPWLYGTACRFIPALLFLTPTRFLPFCLFSICFLSSVGWASLEKRPFSRREAQVTIAIAIALVAAALSFLLPAMNYSVGFQHWLVEMATVNLNVKPPHFEGDFANLFVTRVLDHFSIFEPTIFLSLFVVSACACLTWYGVGRSSSFYLVYSLSALDLLVYFSVMNIPVPANLVTPQLPDVAHLSIDSTLTSKQAPYRILALGQGPEPNLWLPYGISNLEAYESVHPGDFRAVFDALNHGRTLVHQSCVYISSEQIPNGALDLLGVNKLYNRSDQWDARYGAAEFSDGISGIYRRQALRAFLLDNYQVVERDSALQRMMEPDFDARQSVLLSSAPGFPSSQKPDFRAKSPEKYSPHEVRFQVTPENPTLLVLNDLHYPGWRVFVDGQPRELLKAYGFARAVELKPGDSEVVFRFRPTGFPYTPWLAFFLFTVLLTLELQRWKARPSEPNPNS